MTWIVEAIATDGLPSPRKAVRISVLRDERPDPNYISHLEAQTVGQYRVQYQEWVSAKARFREQGVDPDWRDRFGRLPSEQLDEAAERG